jgi:putative drug exporter of the RND superfamily
MSELLARIARTLTHRWKRSLLAAFLALVAIGAAAGAGSPAADDFEIPGTESQQALDLFRAHSPAFAGADSTIVFSVEDGTLEERRDAIDGALDEIRDLRGVEQVADPFAEGGSMSQDGRIAAADVRYDLEPDEIDKDDGEALIEAAETAEQDGVQVEARGILVDLAAEQERRSASSSASASP